MTIGDTVKFVHPDIWDNKEHVVVNVQGVYDMKCLLLDYWGWIDADEFMLVKMDTNKVNVGDYFNDGTLSHVLRIDGCNAYYNVNDYVPVDYAYKHRVTVTAEVDTPVTPSHYNTTKITTLDVVKDWKLGFCLGNTIKYIQRHTLKGNALQDLQKAAKYLQLYIDELKKENANNS